MASRQDDGTGSTGGGRRPGGEANQTLGSATQAALKAALDAGIAAGAASEWNIDLSNGDYGCQPRGHKVRGI